MSVVNEITRLRVINTMEPDFQRYFYAMSGWNQSDDINKMLKRILFSIEKKIYNNLRGRHNWEAEYIAYICGDANNPVWLWNVHDGKRKALWNKFWELIQGAITLYQMKNPPQQNRANWSLLDFDPIFERFHGWGPQAKPSSAKLKF